MREVSCKKGDFETTGQISGVWALGSRFASRFLEEMVSWYCELSLGPMSGIWGECSFSSSAHVLPL